MKKSILTLVSILFTFISSAQNDSELTKEYPEAKKEVNAVIDQIERTIRENDKDGLIDLHAYGPKFTEFDLGGKRQGPKENEAFERNFLGEISEVQKWEYNDLEINVYGGDVANATFHADLEFIVNDQPYKFKMQGTLLFIKTKDGWKITHEHMAPIAGGK